MTKDKRFLFWFNIILLSFLTAALITCGFYDLEISNVLFELTEFGGFFIIIGGLPISLGIIFSSVILYRYVPFKKDRTLILKAIGAGGVFGVCLVIWLNVQSLLNFQDILFKYFTPILLAIITAFTLIYLSKFLPQNFVKKILIFAIFTVVLIIAERFFSATIKLIWQRLRFINIEHTTYSGYTPWWIPHFTSSGREHLVFGELNSKTFMSFNSGTTAAAGNLFAIIMLPEIFKKLKKYRPLFYIIPILYSSLVGASKIIAGQHYITDVIFSIILVYSLTVILKRICLSQKFKKFANFCINLFYKDKTEHIPLNNINT